MGFYIHRGREGDVSILEDLVTAALCVTRFSEVAARSSRCRSSPLNPGSLTSNTRQLGASGRPEDRNGHRLSYSNHDCRQGVRPPRQSSEQTPSFLSATRSLPRAVPFRDRDLFGGRRLRKVSVLPTCRDPAPLRDWNTTGRASIMAESHPKTTRQVARLLGRTRLTFNAKAGLYPNAGASRKSVMKGGGL
jgi:hypothetical protein